MPHRRTLWEEGRHPGSLVSLGAASAVLAVALLHVLLGVPLGAGFDVTFVLACLGAALLVRPRDFFVVGVLPPLMLAGTVVVVALTGPEAVAHPADGIVQATVSGLAHHAGALVAGYALTLAVLAVRHVSARHGGMLRGHAGPRAT